MNILLFLIFVITVESCDLIKHQDTCLKDCNCGWCFNTTSCFRWDHHGDCPAYQRQEKCIGTIEHLWTGILGMIGVMICCYCMSLIGIGCYQIFRYQRHHEYAEILDL